ncbi:MAG TPA: hypothetical protein VLI05_06200 [Candidatus Saccharimonadia bacterium]|nr:hypothetical protein [Candidatus Saccharimonadia bacterium]
MALVERLTAACTSAWSVTSYELFLKAAPELMEASREITSSCDHRLDCIVQLLDESASAETMH